MQQVVPLEVPELGNRCHLVHDGRTALVIDPPRDLDAVERAAEEAGLEIGTVADTHVHDDDVSGALGLARRHGVDYLLSADERVDFERVGVRGGDEGPVDTLTVGVLATPRAHPAPPVVPRQRSRRPRHPLQRRQPALRHTRPHRPGGGGAGGRALVGLTSPKPTDSVC